MNSINEFRFNGSATLVENILCNNIIGYQSKYKFYSKNYLFFIISTKMGIIGISVRLCRFCESSIIRTFIIVRTSELFRGNIMTIFSIASFVITLRETMEAALIVGILLAYLSKTNNDNLKKDVWIGTALALVASVIGAIIFNLVLGGFEGDTEKLFEGIIMTTAAAVLTWMIVWMFRNAHTLKYELEQKTEVVLSNESRYALMGLAFVSVFREGIETVLFLTSVGTNEGVMAEAFGAISGIVVATVLAVLFFRGTVELNIKQFFNITSVILIFFAAGLFSRGIYEFQELGWFGAESNFWNKIRWDTTAILNDKDNGIGSLIRALFGYQDTPSFLELLAYIMYWIMITLMFVKVNKSVLQSPKATTG